SGYTDGLQHSRLKCASGRTGSLRLEAGEFDHLAPLLGLLGDQLAEVGGRAGNRVTVKISHPSLHRWIDERRVDLAIELLNDLGWGALGNADAEEAGDYIAWDGI